MFTGIIEETGIVKAVIINNSNKTFWIESPISIQLKADQSVNHSGVCFTVEEVMDSRHKITAVKETLAKTNINSWETGHLVNLERSLPVSGRLDGHIVQGHIDTTLQCKKIREKNGSFEYEFELPGKYYGLVIEKGSIAINGISLTAYNTGKNSFRVALIPFTLEHTDIYRVKKGDRVNVEFDVLGKYVQRQTALLKS